MTIAVDNKWEKAVLWLREQTQQQQLVHDCYYDDPLSDAARRYWQSEEWACVRAFFPREGRRALDVGAGRGIASYALARDGFSVTALEPNPSPVVGAEAIRSLARESGLDISVTQEFSERLPFQDDQFDLVFARAVLHHTSDLRAACREFFRVLKPGGRLLAVREHVISCPEDLDTFLNGHFLHHLYGGENAFLLGDYEAALREAGFRIDRVIAPLESALNFAPHTLKTLQEEIAAKVTQNLPVLRDLVRFGLVLPGVWSIAAPLLKRIDHRPGRLYSFVATRPE